MQDNLIKTVYFLWLGLCLSLTIATQSRIEIFSLSMGYGEISLISWLTICLVTILIKKKIVVYSLNKKLFVFWLVSFCLLLLGCLYRLILGVNSQFFYHNLIALFFVSCFSFLLFSFHRQKQEIVLISKNIIVISTFIHLILLIWSIYNPEIIGIDLWRENQRYQSLASNPNQLALFFTTTPYFCWHFYKQTHRHIWLILITINLVLGFLTKSDSLLLGWLIGLFVFILAHISYIKSLAKKIIIYFFILSSLVLSSPLLITKIAASLAELFNKEGQQGSARIAFWTNGIYPIKQSLLFGWGPGAYSGLSESFSNGEAHNTIIDWGTQTGILGIIIYVLFLLWICSFPLKSKKTEILAAFTSIFIFSLFHYTLRHPIFWFWMISIIFLSI